MTEEPRHPALDADETEALRAIGWQQSAGGTSCPDPSLLLAADEGVLDEAAASRVRAHVAECATCQQLVRDLATVFAEAPDEDAASRIRSRIAAGASVRRARPYLWAGLGGLALAAGLVWLLVMPRLAPPPVPDTQVARATPPPVPTVFVVDRPAIPPGEIDLAVRGETTPADLNNKVALALDQADADDLKGGLTELATLLQKHPDSRLAGLALGSLQLRDNRNVDALATLERTRLIKTDPDKDDEIDWFLSIALVRAGQRDRARGLLDSVCKHGGARSARACAGLAELDRLPSSR